MTYRILILLGIAIISQAQEPVIEAIPQESVVDYERPDVPDPYAIHTAKGNLLQQPVMSGEDISIMYFQLTGKRVLVSNAFRGIEISIIQPGPLTNLEVAELIETQLILEGFTLTQTPGKPDQLRLLPVTNAKQNGLRIITKESDLPYNDEIVSYQMRLNYIKPEEAVTILQSVIGQFGAAGSIAIVPNASSLIITDNTLLIRTAIDIKNQIDVPSTTVSTKFIKIVYADAEEVVNQLNELINNEENTSSSVQRSGNAPRQNQQGGNQQIQNSQPGEDIPLKILADTRTNRITLLGSGSKIALAESLIREIDQPASNSGYIRRKLQFLPVYEFMPIASNAIEATLGTEGGGQSSTNSGGNTGGNNGGNNNGGNDNGTGTGGRASVGGQDGNTAPESILVGKTLLVADNISNSIVVDGPPHHIEIVQNLINELDRRSEQVAITALFGTYSANDTFDFSSNVFSLYENIVGEGRGLIGAAPSLNGTGISSIISADSLSDFASAAVSTGLNVGFANSEWGVFVNSLKTLTQFEEISRPTVYTTNNRSARITSGSRIAVPTGTFTDSGTTSTNIEFIDVVLELEVRPLVNSPEEVTIEIALVKDALGGSRVIEDLTTQDIDTQELSTIVTVPNKSLILLGGLYTGISDQTKSRVPILGSIPFLGKLFSNESESESLNELVIMVYTQVINSDESLNSFKRNYNSHSYVTPRVQEDFQNNDLINKLKENDRKKTRSDEASEHNSTDGGAGTTYKYDRLPGPRKGSRR